MRAGVVVVVIVVLATASVADAGSWYYTWNCAGKCAPGRLAISGTSSAFPSEEMCVNARWGDPLRHEVLSEGSAGWVSLCSEYDSPPAAGGGPDSQRSVIPTQRYSLGVIMGPAWHVRDATSDTKGRSTVGIDFNFIGGFRPLFGLEVGIGIHRAPIRSPRWAEESNMLFIPWTVGFTSSPGIIRAKKLEVRLDLGAAIVFGFRTGCDDCTAEDVSGSSILWMLRAGLDIYPRAARTPGIGIAGVFLFGKQGSLTDETAQSMVELAPPTFMIRVSLLGRNSNLLW